MMWLVYCHTHIATGRRYIGLTSQTMEKRWRSHISTATQNAETFRHESAIDATILHGGALCDIGAQPEQTPSGV